MRRLFVYRIRNRWFGQLTETKTSEGGDFQEIRNIAIPQSEAEIEKFAEESGSQVEWDLSARP